MYAMVAALLLRQKMAQNSQFRAFQNGKTRSRFGVKRFRVKTFKYGQLTQFWTLMYDVRHEQVGRNTAKIRPVSFLIIIIALHE